MTAAADGQRPAMQAEFDTVAAWTEQIVTQLGPDYAIPAGCRGSGSPAALSWLARELKLRSDERMLDAGAGVAGPAAFAAQHFDARPIVCDPMLHACRAASRLFGLPAIAAAGQRLPFADASFDVAWSLGVLCTTSDQHEILAELRRVLSRSGRLGLLVFVQMTPELPYQPEGNHFPLASSLGRLLERAGFSIAHQADTADFDDPPPTWQRRVEEVESALALAHGADPRWRQAQEQQQLMAQLLRLRHVAGRLVHAVADR